jgi:hypothetical protein
MTPTPLDAKPQGAQLKRYDIVANDYDDTFEEPDGTFCLWADVAPLFERIEKLERDLHDERESHAALQSRCFDSRSTGESIFDGKSGLNNHEN